MGLDPRIIMGFRPTPNVGPDFGKAVQDATNMIRQQQEAEKLKAMQQQNADMQAIGAGGPAAQGAMARLGATNPTMMANAQKLQQQNALRDLLSRPGALDANGNPTPDTIKQVDAISPDLGMKLRHNSLVAEEQRLRLDSLKTESFAKKQDVMYGAYAPVIETYEEEIKAGKSPEQAMQDAQKGLTAANQSLTSGGLFSDDEQKRFPTKFDPLQMRAFVIGSKQYQDWRKSNNQADKAAESKWEVLTDPGHKDANGNPVQYRYNPVSGKATTLDGSEPYTPTGAAKLTNSDAGGTGGLTDDAVDKAAKWYHDTHELPTGFRTKALMTAVMNREAELYPHNSFSVAQQAAVKADRTSLTNLTKQQDAAQAYERSAIKEFDQAEKNIPDTPEPLNSQLLTRWVRTGATSFGDVKVPVYQTYLISGLEEYAKILSGSTGAAGSTDAARKLALSLIPPGATSKQIPEIIKALKKGIQNRTDGYKDQIGAIRARLDKSGNLVPDDTGGDQKKGSGQTAAKPGDLPMAKTDTGNQPAAIPDEAIQYLKANPATAAQFEATFGLPAGGAQRYLKAGDTTPKPTEQPAGDGRQLPELGPMKGQAFLNPAVAPKVPNGMPRPLGPGEYVSNPDGSWSNEITATIGKGDMPELNGGKPTVVPTLWVVNGKPTRVDEDTAARYAAQSGLKFPSFDTDKQAEKFSETREQRWQSVNPKHMQGIPPLWTQEAKKADARADQKKAAPLPNVVKPGPATAKETAPISTPSKVKVNPSGRTAHDAIPVITPDQARALPPGTFFIDPNGVIRQRPMGRTSTAPAA